MNPIQPDEVAQQDKQKSNENQANQAAQIPQVTQPTVSASLSVTQLTVQANPSDANLQGIEPRQNQAKQLPQNNPSDVIDLDDSSFSQLEPYLQNPHTRQVHVEQQTQNIQVLTIVPPQIQKQQGCQVNSTINPQNGQQMRDHQVQSFQNQNANNQILNENIVESQTIAQQANPHIIQGTITVKTTQIVISLPNNLQITNQTHQNQNAIQSIQNQPAQNTINQENADNALVQNQADDRQQPQTPVFQQSKNVLQIPNHTLILQQGEKSQAMHPQSQNPQTITKTIEIEAAKEISNNFDVVANNQVSEMIAQPSINVQRVQEQVSALVPVTAPAHHEDQNKIGMQIEQQNQQKDSISPQNQLKMIEYKQKSVVVEVELVKEIPPIEKPAQLSIDKVQQKQKNISVQVQNKQPQIQQDVSQVQIIQQQDSKQQPLQEQINQAGSAQEHDNEKQAINEVPQINQINQVQENNNQNINHDSATYQGSPQLTDINQIRKVLLEYLPPHIKSLAETLPDDQLREMYLEIRAEEMKAALAQNQIQPEPEKVVEQPKIVVEEPKKETKKKDSPNKTTNMTKKSSPKSNFDRQQQSKQSPEVEMPTKPTLNQSAKNGYGKTIKKERKRIVTTVVQQVQYYDDEDIQGTSKYVILDNGEVRRKKPTNKKQMQGILTQLCSLVRSLDLTAFSDTNSGPVTENS